MRKNGDAYVNPRGYAGDPKKEPQRYKKIPLAISTNGKIFLLMIVSSQIVREIDG